MQQEKNLFGESRKVSGAVRGKLKIVQLSKCWA